MRKKLLLFLIFLFCFLASQLVGQTLSIKPYGVSPRDAGKDSLDIFDRAYNGLLNVGKETQMYLMAKIDVGILSNGTWSVLEKPTGSIAAFGPSISDSNSQITIFTPDLTGKYVIEFTDGGLSATLTINSGTFLGAEDASCLLCHNDKASTWQDTRHASKLTRGVQGLVSSYYNVGCIECHTVGFDENANNGGFDDWEFVFPESLYIGADQDLATAYPDAWKRANIQCESCHGPGSEHFGNKEDNKIAVTLMADNCAQCHDAGTHHVFPEQWDQTGHANPPTYPTGSGRSSCARCHTPEGFIEYVSGEVVNEHEWAPFSCAMCHDPHTNFGEDALTSDRHQLRTTNATLSNGFVVEKGGAGVLCMNCHQSRRDAEDYTKSRLTRNSSHFGPHYMTQADMFNATNVATFGYNLPSSPHITAIENTCIHCHMNEEKGKVDENNNVTMVGMHTFAVEDLKTGEHNVAICAPCHGELGSFNEKKYYDNNFIADHDGDGIEEGVHDEVKGLLHELAVLLPHADTTEGYDPHDTVTPDFTLNELKAAFNYEMVYYDRSKGIHNPAFTVSLLKVSIEALKYGTITAGNIQSITDVPLDQGFQVRLVWTKFGADDGIAPDQVESYIILRKVDQSLGKVSANYSSISEIPVSLSKGSFITLEGETWDVVDDIKAVQFGEYSAVVPTLYNTTEGDTVLSTFKVLGKSESGMVAETEPMSGFSVDNLAPAVPGGLSISLDGNKVQLVWDESAEVDLNYYSVYRMVSDPSNEKEYLGSVSTNQFIDTAPPSDELIYYRISASDISRNESDLSSAVSIIVTDISSENGVPTKYALEDNYPNPFNPSTTIEYAIPEETDIVIRVYDILGNLITEEVRDKSPAGYYKYVFDARNISSGIYMYQISANNFNNVKKMILLK